MDNKIEIRALSRGIGSKLFNQQVKERYHDNDNLLNACLIRDWDTMPEITYKHSLFYFVLNNFMPVYDEKVHVRGKAKSSISLPWMVLHLKFAERYIKDRETGEMKPIGQRRIKISNIDIATANAEAVKRAFDGKSIIYGRKYVTYNFANGKEIKLQHIDSEAMGIDLISTCIPFTMKDTRFDGDVSKNILTVSIPENAPNTDTFGLRGHIWKATFHERQGKKTNQLFRVLIANRAKQ
jgi:hypothetical protein